MHKITIAVQIEMSTKVIDVIPEEGSSIEEAASDARKCKDLDIDLRTRFIIDTGAIMLSGHGVFPRSFGDLVEKEIRKLLYENGYMKEIDGFSEIGTG